MDFIVEFYVTEMGGCPVLEFLEELRHRDPPDHAAVLRGLAKLKNRQYHRGPRHPSQGTSYRGERHRHGAGTDARLAGKVRKLKKTNFDLYLEEQLKDPVFAERFDAAGEAWDVALQIAALREKAGMSQKELARKLHTSQQQVSRLESPVYEGHSLSMLRRVARALNAEVKVTFEPVHTREHAVVAESQAKYGSR